MTCQDKWCGACYENKRSRANHKGHRWYRRPRKPYVPPFWEVLSMKKPDKPAGGPASVGTPAKGTLFSGMPLLWEMLTASFYDDGSKRYRSTVLLICDGEAAKICLLDGDIGRQAWSTGETIEQALETLEDQLQRDAVSWQPGKKRESKKSRD